MMRIFATFTLMTLVLSIVLPVHAQTQTVKPLLGTWKRIMPNTATPGAPSGSATNQLDAAGNGFHFVEDVADAKGPVLHIEYTVESFDGKDYAWKATDGTGKPLTVADAIAFQKIDDYTYELLNKKMGEVIMTQKWVLSKDGRTRTVTSTRKQGNTMTTVYEKE